MNRQHSLKKILLLIIVSFVFEARWACSSGEAFQTPNLSLKKVRIVGMDQTAVSLEGTLEIFNPNEMSSRFSGYTYQLEVEGQRLLTGASDQPFNVPAQGTFYVTIPATLLIEDLVTLSKKDLFNRDLKYRLTGSALLDSRVGKLPLPFSHEGTINLSERLRENLREFLEGL